MNNSKSSLVKQFCTDNKIDCVDLKLSTNFSHEDIGLSEPVARSCWDPECEGCFGCCPDVLEEFHEHS